MRRERSSQRAVVAASAPDADLDEIKNAKEATLAELEKLDEGVRRGIEFAFSGVIDSLEAQAPNGTSMPHYLKTKAVEQCQVLDGYAFTPHTLPFTCMHTV